MSLVFAKWHHLGNDFVMIDGRAALLPSGEAVRYLCDRKQGIGADGVVVLTESDFADFRMRIFNSDGSEARMCGNALLCLPGFMQSCGFTRPKYLIETLSGLVTIGSGPDCGSYFSCLNPRLIDANCQIGGRTFLQIDAGAPHAVCLDLSPYGIDLEKEGSAVRWHPMFAPQGTNVCFAEFKEGEAVARVFEKGCEAETESCGTGALAIALACRLQKGYMGELRVKYKYGHILVSLDEKDAYLKGKAEFVFAGKINERTSVS